MNRDKYTFRLNSDLLKEMKKTAIEMEIPLNKLLIMSYDYFKNNHLLKK